MAPLSGLSPPQRALLLLGMLGNGIVFLDQSSVSAALPTIQGAFDSSGAEAQWVMGIYLLALAAFVTAAGRLGDLYGRGRMLLLGAITVAVSSLACALAPTEEALIAARALDGLGAALTVPNAIAIVTASLPEAHRGWAIGVLGAGGTAFLPLGVLAGGFLVDVASWRWVFVLAAVLAGSVLVLGLRGRRGDERRRRSLDLAGLALLVGGLTALMTALLKVQDWGLLDARSLAVLALALALLLALVLRERAAAEPLIDLAFLRIREVRGALGALAAIQFAVLGLTVYMLVYLQLALGYGPAAAALISLPPLLGSPLLSPLVGRMADRHGARRFIVGGLVAGALSLAWIGLAAPSGAVVLLMPALVLFAIARPLVFTPAGSAAVGAIPREQRGLASGLITETRQIGAALGVAVLGAVLSAVELGTRTRLLAGSDADLGVRSREALDGLLTGGQSGRSLLAELSPERATAAVDAASSAYASGFGAAMLAATAVLLAAAVAGRLLLWPRRG